uniref:ATP synthase B chain n=1 Tax=Synarthrophyton chejuense TaxID=2485825 RepID=A0A3G3MII4_9FLOR|nr:ATP synthase B chain precursor [Synarthrophyton chejuense]AYR06646.1 ATP synthase B chain precursor [Synarthrophyton chejuense]
MLLSLLFLVYKKIILLNEETLILLSFITFVYLTSKNYGDSFSKYLENESNNIKNNLLRSLKKIYFGFLKFSEYKKNVNLSIYNFSILGNYYRKLMFLFINSLKTFNKINTVIVFKKRLDYLKKIEDHTTKLLALLIIKKLNKVITLKKFYGIHIKNRNFLCKNKITLLEYIKIINKSEYR